jgi:hypothetical protein
LLEIGHGDLSQCSVPKGSHTEKKILSVCTFGKQCTVIVKIMPRTEDELKDMDNTFILDKDKVLSIHSGH